MSFTWGFSVGSVVKNPLPMPDIQETWQFWPEKSLCGVGSFSTADTRIWEPTLLKNTQVQEISTEKTLPAFSDLSVCLMSLSVFLCFHLPAYPSLRQVLWFWGSKGLSCSHSPCYCGCLVTKSRLTLCNPMDCSPTRLLCPWDFQTGILEWVAISFSRGSSQPRDWTLISCLYRWVLYHWATWETPTTLVTRKLLMTANIRALPSIISFFPLNWRLLRNSWNVKISIYGMKMPKIKEV